MSGPLNIQQNWPNFPVSQPTDSKGKLTNEWQQMLQQFVSYGQQNLSGEGFNMPQQTTANINTLVSAENSKIPDGAIWYNTTNKCFQGKVDGQLVTFMVVF